MELKVQIKQAGKRENKIITAKLLLKESPKIVRELIISAVKASHSIHREKIRQVESFENGDLDAIIVCSQEEIEQKAASGKIDFGVLKSSADVTEKQAVETALQAFEDGLVVVFIDGIRYENVDEKIELMGTETVTFVRLTMLTGRIW